ncbi:hypothetical protein EV356DRAFT_503496 [Viridothelium virens]|uniref:Methyltransferase domain-containing protein n=1 Tax=Viridothelium virens TaxID=1048519 RepID=A0A6A6H620_VIRVR|nr:hypothetical protein EV356DRAFT_503496 [Viridothelium virens]
MATSASKYSDQPSPKQDTYALGRDFRSASRLGHQHYLWHETLGFHLHPLIANTLPPVEPPRSDEKSPPPRIADIACGSASWLRSVALSLPHTQLNGHDISLAQCPPHQWLPVNITLGDWDLFSSPTEDMLERFDVVHTRLIFTIVEGQTEDEGLATARRVVSGLLKLLKPGGWLQWDELDVARSFLLRADPAAEAPAPTMERFLSVLKQKGKWVERLVEVMEETGMQEARLWRYEERKDLAKQFFENNLMKDEEMANGALRGTEEGRRLGDTVEKMWDESREGVVVCTPKVVVTATKPKGAMR